VSKCGPRVQARPLRWLAGHDYARTGLPADQVRFCRARPDKRQHCLELGLTHFADDHPEVHAASWADLDALIRASLDGRPGMAVRNGKGGCP
jgi:hypothetical protein